MNDRKKLSFTRVKTISDLFPILTRKSDSLNLLSLDVFQHHLQSLLTLRDENQESFLNFIHYVDEVFSTDYHPFIRYKLETILSAATYYHDFYNEICCLSAGELSVLANFSSSYPVEVYPEYLKMFPKPVLNVIENKTNNFMIRNDLMSFVSLSLEKGVSDSEVFEQLQLQSLSSLRRQSNLWQLDSVGGPVYDSRGVQL